MEGEIRRDAVTQIRKHLVILNNRMPFEPGIRKYFSDIEEREWVRLNMRLEGSVLSAGQIEAISDGEVCLGISVADHLKISVLKELLEKMRQMAQMKRILDLGAIDEFYHVISGATDKSDREKYVYRRKNIILRELDLTPAIPADIPEKMDALAAELIQAEGAEPGGSHMFLHAAYIHNRLIMISPYGEEDKLLARAAASYYIMSKGFPAVVPHMKESEYNKVILKYIKNKGITDSAYMWQDAMLERLGLMRQLTRY